MSQNTSLARARTGHDQQSLAAVFDASALLLPGESLAAPVSIAATPAGLLIASVAIAGAQVTGWISGGTAGTLYAVTASAATTQGRTLIASASLFVGPSGLDDPLSVAPESP